MLESPLFPGNMAPHLRELLVDVQCGTPDCSSLLAEQMATGVASEKAKEHPAPVGGPRLPTHLGNSPLRRRIPATEPETVRAGQAFSKLPMRRTPSPDTPCPSSFNNHAMPKLRRHKPSSPEPRLPSPHYPVSHLPEGGPFRGVVSHQQESCARPVMRPWGTRIPARTQRGW